MLKASPTYKKEMQLQLNKGRVRQRRKKKGFERYKKEILDKRLEHNCLLHWAFIIHGTRTLTLTKSRKQYYLKCKKKKKKIWIDTERLKL